MHEQLLVHSCLCALIILTAIIIHHVLIANISTQRYCLITCLTSACDLVPPNYPASLFLHSYHAISTCSLAPPSIYSTRMRMQRKIRLVYDLRLAYKHRPLRKRREARNAKRCPSRLHFLAQRLCRFTVEAWFLISS